MLPSHPLLRQAYVIRILERDLVLWVIMSCQVTQDSRSLKNGEVFAVVVNDDWDTSIGTVFREPGLFLDVLHDINTLPGVVFAVRGFELFEND